MANQIVNTNIAATDLAKGVQQAAILGTNNFKSSQQVKVRLTNPTGAAIENVHIKLAPGDPRLFELRDLILADGTVSGKERGYSSAIVVSGAFNRFDTMHDYFSKVNVTIHEMVLQSDKIENWGNTIELEKRLPPLKQSETASVYLNEYREKNGLGGWSDILRISGSGEKPNPNFPHTTTPTEGIYFSRIEANSYVEVLLRISAAEDIAPQVQF